MDEKIRLVVDQFGIQSGNSQQNPANICVVDSAAHKASRGRGSLYLLVESLQGNPIPQPFYGEIARTAVDAYYTASGSITRGLRSALLAANDLLFERNLRADSEHRAVVGLNCAIIRGSDVYLGQLGPALTSLVHERDLLQWPTDSTWLRSENPNTFDLNHEPPTGLRREVEPNLFHATLSPGDVLILSATALIRLASPNDLVNAVSGASSETARRNLQALARGRDLSAVLILCPGEQQVAGRTAQKPTSIVEAEARQQPEVASAPEIKTTKPADMLSAESEIPAEGSARPVRMTLAVVPRSGATAEPEVSSREPAKPPDEASALEREAFRSDPQEPQRPRADFGALRDSLSQGAENLRRGAEDFIVRVLPDALPEPPPERAARHSISLSGQALVLVALAIPLVMLFLVIMARVQYERTRHEQFAVLQDEAQQEYETGMSLEEDRTAQRQHLDKALAATEEGLAITPGDDTLTQIQRRIYHKLDLVDKVQRIFHFWQLAELDKEAASPTDASRIVIEGINVFLVNRGGDRVWKYLLNDVGDALQPVDTSSTLIQKGEVRGGIRVGDIVDIAWLEAGGQRTLSTFVSLERAGSLLAYDPQQGIDVLPVANSDSWLKPQAIGSYQGNLYILDPLLNRLMKYVPTDNAYTTPPAEYLNPQVSVDLTGAVDMTIDGNLYILFADGQIAKFFKGDPLPFSMQGLPTPMRSPTCIFVSGSKKPDALGYIYVADAGNERILQFDKNGSYLRQFQANPGEIQMKRLRGLYVDEDKGRLFILSGKTLWLCDIPRLGTEQ